MLSFVRSGPKILIIEPKDFERFRKFIHLNFPCKKLPDTVCCFEDVISEIAFDETLIYLADKGDSNITNFDMSRVVVISEGNHNFFMHTINQGGAADIVYIRKGPRIVIMKVLGDMLGTIGTVAEDFKAVPEETRTIFKQHMDGTIICFTGVNINRKVEFDEFYKQAIYTKSHFTEVIDFIDHHGLKYINRNVGGDVWYELTIKIYDVKEAYKIQYDRLIHVLDHIGSNLILREGWSEETRRLFQSVGIYKITLFTHLEPNEIKKILLALEYLENGERIVDFDVYYKRKKLHWEDIRKANIKKRSTLSLHYRHELYKQLEKDSIIGLKAMEDYIFASR
jgi:hypothetical protein